MSIGFTVDINNAVGAVVCVAAFAVLGIFVWGLFHG